MIFSVAIRLTFRTFVGMKVLVHKATQYWWPALKLFLLGACFWYLFQKLQQYEKAIWQQILIQLNFKNIGWLVVFTLLTIGNWCFEIVKWKQLASTVRKLNVTESVQQVFAAFTVSLPTPNRLGEYAGKVFFYTKSERKKILFLNAIHNGWQLFTTLLFGTVGLIFLSSQNHFSYNLKEMMVVGAVLIGLALIAFSLWKKEVGKSGYSLEFLWRKASQLSQSLHLKTFGLSVARYACFATLFYLLLQFFGADISFVETWPYLTAMYLLVSIVPSFVLADVVIRGSVAVWLFSLLSIPATVVIATVLSVWLLNFALPALIGSYFVTTTRLPSS
ncbi:lysylphosphatidylglycerol synthase domain-containing protein [Luteirhabdus pelagi]|uniref:lysylphosphatidylglycerol synthase domain-containing protein n=1 Tax=Luteirhabdus pelagi TaxID=2792783 RepID=UPI00193AB1AE|nr:lysylphosphatidylglycerol synthase domain-containing protein [Luteirhabdus pelagi]